MYGWSKMNDFWKQLYLRVYWEVVNIRVPRKSRTETANKLSGITVSQLDDPFSVANSTARLAFVGREFFTCSSLFHLDSRLFVFVCSIRCSVRNSEASGGWRSCSTVQLTSGLVTLIEASYSEDEVTTGSVNPRPPMRRETKEVALYFSDCMVSDSWYENLINRALEWLK